MTRNIENIEKRNDSYRVHISYYDEMGKRKFYSKSFSIRKYGNKQKALEMAKKHRDEIKLKLANNILIKNKFYSLRDVFELSMNLYQCTKETKRKLKLIFNKYVLAKIDPSINFAYIKYTDIQQTLNNMVSIASDDTIQRVFSIWKRLYKNAIASDIVYKDETYNINVPKSDLIQNKRKMETNINELMDICNKIEDSIDNNRDKELLIGSLWIMYFTGMRPAEVFALHEKNIDLSNNFIYVCQSLGSTSTDFNTIKKTKNNYSIRYIPICNQLQPILKELINKSVDGFLFIRDNNNFLNSTYLSNITRKLSNKTFRPYMLRHQFSTDLIINGVDIRTIQEMMGHASSKMTINYARSNNNLKIKALESRNKDIKMIENIS